MIAIASSDGEGVASGSAVYGRVRVVVAVVAAAIVVIVANRLLDAG